jgi:hypothetical protein
MNKNCRELSDGKLRWAALLSLMVQEFRLKHPDDDRSDRDICEGIMQHFLHTGLVERRDEKWIIPVLKF